MSKTVFITGASRGIGRACALEFAKNGYDIIANYLERDDAAVSLEKEVKKLGREILLLKGDVADPERVKEMVRDARVYFKNISVLINNAGIAYREFFDRVTIQKTRRIIDTNILGVVNITRELLPYLKREEKSFIINMSSCWGRAGGALEVDYSMTKGAVNAFTKALAKEVYSLGIRVNAIAPGAVETDMLSNLTEEDRVKLNKTLFFSKIESPENIAKLASFLVSPAGENITGEILGSSGGLVI